MLRQFASGASLVGVSLVAIATLALAGCTTSPSTQPPSTAAPLPTQTAQPGGPDVEPEAPPAEFVEGGSAADNAPYAQRVVQERADAEGERPGSTQVADALIAGGFERESLEVTADRTPLGLPTDVISFAVRVDDDCIIGEVRGTDVTASVAPVLATGRCLVGADVSID